MEQSIGQSEWGYTTIAVIVGGLLSIATTVLVELVRRRGERRNRWEERLFDLSRDFVGATRRFRHHAERLPRDDEAEKSKRIKAIDGEHHSIRALGEQLRLVGTTEVQKSARLIQREAWAVWREASNGKDPWPEKENPRNSTEPPRGPIRRLNDELHDFYVAVRKQLRIRKPDDVIDDDPAKWNEPVLRDAQ